MEELKPYLVLLSTQIASSSALILITASTSSEHLTDAETADCLVMGKPVLPEDMERLMREALKQPPGRGSR